LRLPISLLGETMEVARTSVAIMLRLEHGEDILESIAHVTRDERSTLLVSTGLGMIYDFELGYFDRGNYIKKAFSEPHEILALQGTIASSGEPRIHVHATVADSGHRAFGGHLMKGKVWMSNEIGLVKLERVFSTRKMDPEKKIGILHVEGR